MISLFREHDSSLHPVVYLCTLDLRSYSTTISTTLAADTTFIMAGNTKEAYNKNVELFRGEEYPMLEGKSYVPFGEELRD